MQTGLQPPSAEAEQEALADSKRKVIFVLERANLEVAKVGKVTLPQPEQCPGGGAIKHSYNNLGEVWSRADV